VKLSPSLTYHHRVGEIAVRGRWFGDKRAWDFELICLGEDIIWQSSSRIEKGEVTSGPLSKVLIQVLLKYFEKTKQTVIDNNLSDFEQLKV